MLEPFFSRRKLLRAGGAVLALQASRPRGERIYAAPPTAAGPCLAAIQTKYPPLVERFVAKLDPAADDFPEELYAFQIGKILDVWSGALRSSLHAMSAMENALAEDASALAFEPSHTTPLRTTGALRIERRTFEGPEIAGRSHVLKSWETYLAEFSRVETAEFEIYSVLVTAANPLTVTTSMRCDLVGGSEDGVREQRVGAWTITWVRRESASSWTALRWTMQPEIRSCLRGAGFTDITMLCLDGGSLGLQQLLPGIDHWRTELDGSCGIDVYGNHGVAVGDIDGSGFDSFYVCQPSGLPNRLYRNRGDGTFEDITDVSGTGLIDGTASALFADFSNRGMQDLLVVRSAGPLLFVNRGGGHFEPRPDAFHFARPPEGTFTSVAAADYNRDGFLDLYFCVYSYYQGLNQYQFPSPYYDAQNGPPNFLFRNRGDGTFEDVTAASGMDQNNNRFSFAAAWCESTGDGWPDLYVANDFGRKNFYRSNGNGTFRDAASDLGVEDYGPGMSVCWLDYDNDGRQDLYVANMWLAEGKRITASAPFLPAAPSEVRALYRKHNAGNSMYRNVKPGQFADRSVAAGTAMARWSWSCASWDFDHDGWPDLYVANGFVSGPDRFDLQSFFWRQVAQRSFAQPGASQDYEMAWNAANELLRSGYSWSGYERNVFYANNRDGTFSDVSGVLGLDLKDDSRAYALADIDHDGRLEMILKNRSGPQVRILRNDMAGLGAALSFHLTGRTSNRDAIGAIVTVEAGGSRQTKFVSAGSGFASQHTKDLFFGIGEAAGPVSVAVQWPAGSVAHFENIPVNHRIHIVEGVKDFQSVAYQVSSRTSGHSAQPTVPLPPESIRTWLVSPVFGPDIEIARAQGTPRKLSEFRGRAAVLAFFRSDCGDGMTSLDRKSFDTFAAAGLTLLAVEVGAAARSPDVPVFQVDERAIGAWNIFWRYLFDRRRDMPLPVSFLLNADGAIVKVYQGPVDAMEIVRDSRSEPTDAKARLARALPFPGPYFGNAMAHNYFTDGIAFVQYGYEEHAREAFEREVKIDPNNAGAWFNLGTIYLGRKALPEARKYLQESVRLNPQDADAWNNLGMIAGEEQNYDQALEYFQKAARANPNHLLAVQNMVRILQYQGRAADAQRILEELVARSPGNSDLHLGLGMALVAQKQLERARAELETAVKLRPDNADALNDLGALQLRMGNRDEALSLFEQCRRAAPDLDRAYLNIAILYKGQGEIVKARKVLEEYLSRHPENADVRSALEKLAVP